MVLFCCGVLLCGRWWCGPDTEFDGVCADIVFFLWWTLIVVKLKT